MPVREVLVYPDPLLKEIAPPAPRGEQLDQIVTDLIDTMRSFPGCVGISAPQIGELYRVAVIDLTGHRKAPPSTHGLTLLIDPEVTASSGSEVAREGCLSIPDLTANVRRATDIAVKTRDERLEFEAFEARLVLHEVDHLDGLLFLDRVDSLTDVFERKQRSSQD